MRATSPRTATLHTQLPFALTPGPPIGTKPLRDSIADDRGRRRRRRCRRLHADAIDRHPAAPTATHPQRPPAAPRRRCRRRRSPRRCSTSTRPTWRCTARPAPARPYTAAQVIATLVNDHGWRIGVVAQSHAVVENLFGDVIHAGRRPGAGRQEAQHRDAPAGPRSPTRSSPASSPTTTGCVVGGTAWDFANANRFRRDSLDLLVIDEAGQFCLANTIAVSRAARNLLLLGDPQQLPQVSQGTHPEPVDGSALGWLVDGHRTLPAERGYFLDRSYRMHPAVCARGVAAVLRRQAALARRSAPPRADSTGVAPGRAGAVRRPRRQLDRESGGGRRRSSRRSKGCSARRGPTSERHPAAGPADVLVVTPYNAQVVLLRRRLDAAGLADVRVGHRRQVPGTAGTGGLRLHDGVVRSTTCPAESRSCSTGTGSTSPSAGPSTSP